MGILDYNSFESTVMSDPRWNTLTPQQQEELKQKYEEQYGTTAQLASDETDPTEMGDLRRGWESGVQQTQAGLYGMAGLAGSALGIDALKDWGMEGYQRNVEEASKYPTLKFTDIDSPGTAVDYVQGTVGNLVPSMIEAAAGAFFTGGVGYGLARQGVKSAAKKLAASTIEKQVAKGLIKEGLKDKAESTLEKHLVSGMLKGFAKKGANIKKQFSKAGMLTAVGALESGSNYGEVLSEHGIDAPYSALGFGSLAASLELLGGNSKLIDMFVDGVAKGTKGKFLKRAAKAILTNARQEALQEAGQETLSILNIVANTDEAFLTKENLSRIFESGVAGLVMGVGGGALQSTMTPEAEPTIRTDPNDPNSPTTTPSAIAEAASVDEAIAAFEQQTGHKASSAWDDNYVSAESLYGLNEAPKAPVYDQLYPEVPAADRMGATPILATPPVDTMTASMQRQLAGLPERTTPKELQEEYIDRIASDYERAEIEEAEQLAAGIKPEIRTPKRDAAPSQPILSRIDTEQQATLPLPGESENLYPETLGEVQGEQVNPFAETAATEPKPLAETPAMVVPDTKDALSLTARQQREGVKKLTPQERQAIIEEAAGQQKGRVNKVTPQERQAIIEDTPMFEPSEMAERAKIRRDIENRVFVPEEKLNKYPDLVPEKDIITNKTYKERAEVQAAIKKEENRKGAIPIVNRVQAAIITGRIGTAQLKDELEAALIKNKNKRVNEILRKKIDELSPEEMRIALQTDHLTGLKNKRAYNESEKLPVQTSIDVDSLKWINDNLGHLAGDDYLRYIGAALRDDNAYHLSGDEFAVQGKTEQEVDEVIKKAEAYLENNPIAFKTEDGTIIKLKGAFSYGKGETFEDADKELRQAKIERELTGDRAARGEKPKGVISDVSERKTNPDEEAQFSEDLESEELTDKDYDEIYAFFNFQTANEFTEKANKWAKKKGFTYAAQAFRKGEVYAPISKLSFKASTGRAQSVEFYVNGRYYGEGLHTTDAFLRAKESVYKKHKADLDASREHLEGTIPLEKIYDKYDAKRKKGAGGYRRYGQLLTPKERENLTIQIISAIESQEEGVSYEEALANNRSNVGDTIHMASSFFSDIVDASDTELLSYFEKDAIAGDIKPNVSTEVLRLRKSLDLSDERPNNVAPIMERETTVSAQKLLDELQEADVEADLKDIFDSPMKGRMLEKTRLYTGAELEPAKLDAEITYAEKNARKDDSSYAKQMAKVAANLIFVKDKMREENISFITAMERYGSNSTARYLGYDFKTTDAAGRIFERPVKTKKIEDPKFSEDLKGESEGDWAVEEAPDYTQEAPREPKTTSTSRSGGALSNTERMRRTQLDKALGAAGDTRTTNYIDARTKNQRVVATIGRMLGMNVRFFETKNPELKTIGGFTYPGSRDIFINTTNRKPELSILGHELVHKLRNFNPEAYSHLVKQLIPLVDWTKFEEYADKKSEAIKKRKGEPLSKDKLFEEFIGDFASDQFQNTEFWTQMYISSPSLTQQIINTVKDLISKLRSIVTRIDKDAIKDRAFAGKELAKALNTLSVIDETMMDAKDSALKQFTEDLKAPTFYSKMQQVIASKLSNNQAEMMRMQLESWAGKKKLKKKDYDKIEQGKATKEELEWSGNAEFKKEELEWSGLLDWLKEKKGKVKKQEVLDYLEANAVTLIEVPKGALSAPIKQKQALKEQAKINVSKKYDIIKVKSSKEPTIEDKRRFVVEQELAESPDLRENEDGIWEDLASGETFANYDALVTSSVNADRERISDEEIEDTFDAIADGRMATYHGIPEEFDTYAAKRKSDGKRLDITGPSKAAVKDKLISKEMRELNPELVSTNLSAAATKHHSWQLPGGKDYSELLLILKGEDEEYVSSHWSERSVLSHVRFSTRELDGKKVLHIEEVQSDWHQAGRKKGYKRPVHEIWVDGNFAIGNLESKEAAEKELQSNLDEGLIYDTSKTEIRKGKAEKGVPDAPFKKTWRTLVMKRMVRYAAENDYDTLAWTQGKEQAKRYRLSTKISEIKATPVITVSDVRNQLEAIAKDVNETLVYNPDGSLTVRSFNQVKQKLSPLEQLEWEQLRTDALGFIEYSEPMWDLSAFNMQEGLVFEETLNEAKMRETIGDELTDKIIGEKEITKQYTGRELKAYVIERNIEQLEDAEDGRLEGDNVALANNLKDVLFYKQYNKVSFKEAMQEEGSRALAKFLGGDFITTTQISGIDLDIGGEKLKGLYDIILPIEMNKMFNKVSWGSAKVEEIELDSAASKAAQRMADRIEIDGFSEDMPAAWEDLIPDWIGIQHHPDGTVNAFAMDDGAVLSGTYDSEVEAVGEVLVNEGLISEEDLQAEFGQVPEAPTVNSEHIFSGEEIDDLLIAVEEGVVPIPEELKDQLWNVHRVMVGELDEEEITEFGEEAWDYNDAMEAFGSQELHNFLASKPTGLTIYEGPTLTIEELTRLSEEITRQDWQNQISGIQNEMEVNGASFEDAVLEYASPEFVESWGGKLSAPKVEPTKLHALPITDEMKDKALYEGFPLFSEDLAGEENYGPSAVTPLTEADYAQNRAIQKSIKETVLTNLMQFKRAAGKITDEYLGSLSTRLKNINPKLAYRLRRLDYNINTKVTDDVKKIEPLMRKARKKMSRDDFADWDFARKNSEKDKIAELVNKYGLTKEYEAYRETLDAIRNKALDVGMEVGYIKDYTPRVLKDAAGFLKHLGKGADWAVISNKLRDYAEEQNIKVSDLTIEKKADIISNMILNPAHGLSSTMKSRKLKKLNAELNKFYLDSDAAVMAYVHNMRSAIATRRFFGKVPERIMQLKRQINAVTKRLSQTNDKQQIAWFEDDLKYYRKQLNDYKHQRDFTENIGEYVRALVENKEAAPDKERELIDMLSARFNEKGMHGILQAYKNLSYIDTMGSPISALTQLGDLAWSIYVGGLMPTLKHTYKSFVKKSNISKEDVGIERIAQEFVDPGTLGKAVNKVFKMVQLERMDAIGKEALLNSAFDSYKKQANSNPAKLRKALQPIFEEETEDVIADLQNGEVTENTKFLVYNKLLDFQPVAMSEMPQKYLTAGNGRIFYMLKSFTLKQFDVFRRECFQKLKSKDSKERIQGMRNLIMLSSIFVLANAGADEIKDFFLNRDTELKDRTVDNVLRLFGVSKFVTWKARTEGLGSAMVRQIAPPFKFIDAATKDIVRAAGGGDNRGLESLASVPVIGKLAYWHMGRGKGNRNSMWERRLSKKKKRLNKIKEQLDTASNKEEYKLKHYDDFLELRKLNKIQGRINKYKKKINQLSALESNKERKALISMYEKERINLIKNFLQEAA